MDADASAGADVVSRLQSDKRAAADAVNRALALALRSPIAAATLAKRSAAPTSATRHGQHANPVPLTRYGKPNQ